MMAGDSRIRWARPVTPEAAGSSPVDPAISRRLRPGDRRSVQRNSSSLVQSVVSAKLFNDYGVQIVSPNDVLDPAAPATSCGNFKVGQVMDRDFVERRDESFYLVGSRVPLASIVREKLGRARRQPQSR